MCEFLLIECEDQWKSDTFSVINLFVEGTIGSYIINSIDVLDGSSHGYEENLLYVMGYHYIDLQVRQATFPGYITVFTKSLA